jgi:hypothetical protein
MSILRSVLVEGVVVSDAGLQRSPSPVDLVDVKPSTGLLPSSSSCQGVPFALPHFPAVPPSYQPVTPKGVEEV